MPRGRHPENVSPYTGLRVPVCKGTYTQEGGGLMLHGYTMAIVPCGNPTPKKLPTGGGEWPTFRTARAQRAHSARYAPHVIYIWVFSRVVGGSIPSTGGTFPVRAEFRKNVAPKVGVCCTFLKYPRKGLFGDVWVRGRGYGITFLRNFGQKLDGSNFLGSLPVQPAQVIWRGFKVNGVALTYCHFTTQPSRLNWCILMCRIQKKPRVRPQRHNMMEL